MNKAFEDIKKIAHLASLFKAAEKYDVDKTNCLVFLMVHIINKTGVQAVTIPMEEEFLVVNLLTISKLGIPLTAYDMRCFGKDYLDRQGKKYF